MNNFACKLAMMTSYHRNRFLLITVCDGVNAKQCIKCGLET